MIHILPDNARILASSFRSMTCANAESKTALAQRGITLILSSVREQGCLRIIFRMDVKESRDRYSTEIRDITNVGFTGEELVIETASSTHRFDAREHPCGCKPSKPHEPRPPQEHPDGPPYEKPPHRPPCTPCPPDQRPPPRPIRWV